MAFVPRLNDTGIRSSIHWYSNDNPYYATGYGMPNCTAYAWGRFWEIGDPNEQGIHKPDPYELPGYWDGGAWWNRVDRNVYQTGQTPALGAVICFSDNNGGSGHVAIVEVINQDGSIVTSNSAYGGTFFYTQTLYPNNNYGWTHYTCQGFIYNPYGDTPTPPVPGNRPKGKFPWVLYANKIRNK